jgi:VanZ family protein
MSKRQRPVPNDSRRTGTFLIVGGVLLLALGALLVHPAVPRFIRGHLPRSIDIRGFGYVAHTTSYALLSILLLTLIRPRRRVAAMLLVTGISIHALLTEAAQYWVPARDCDPLDLLANLAGMALGVVSYLSVFRFGSKRGGVSLPAS